VAYRTRIPPHLDPVGEANSWEPPAEPPAYQTDSPGKQLLPVETTCPHHRGKAARAIRPKYPAYGLKLSQPAGCKSQIRSTGCDEPVTRLTHLVSAAPPGKGAGPWEVQRSTAARALDARQAARPRKHPRATPTARHVNVNTLW
jgi:hypothetical protein